MERAKWFSKQIMITLGGGEKYRNFLTSMRDFKEGKISNTEAVSRVKELLNDHHDLLRGLSFFLQTTVRTDNHSLLQRKQFGDDDDDDDQDSQIRHDAAGNYINKASASQPITVEADEGSPNGQFSDDEVSQIHQITEFVNKVRERFKDDISAYKYFLDSICRYKEEGSQAGEEIKRLFKNYPDLYIEFTRFEADCYTTVGTKRLPKFKERRKTDESYQKHCKKRNSYEAMIFKCEDDQLEADVQLNRLESAIINMAEFLEVVKETDVQIDVKRYFTPMDLGCIEQIYDWKDEDGGYGLGVIDLLCAFPVDASTSILDRLIQKFKELEELRHKANRVSAKVYKDCHEKRGKNCR